MKRFLSMLALAVLVLQSVVTSAVYAVNEAGEGTVPEAAVETVASDPVSDEGNDNDVVTDLTNSEDTTTEVGETTTPVVEEEAAPELMLNSALGEFTRNLSSFESSDPTEISWDEFLERWNTESHCEGLGCVENAKQGRINDEDSDDPSDLLHQGDVGMWKLVQEGDNPGEYQVSIGVRGEDIVSETVSEKKVCAVVVFDKSKSMEDKCENRGGCRRKSKLYRYGEYMGVGDKWNNAVNGAVSFSNALRQAISQSYVGLVLFSTEAEEKVSLAPSALNPNNFGSPEGGTNLHAGLKAASNMLSTSTCEGANKYVVVISDGEPTYFVDDSGDIKGYGNNNDPFPAEYNGENGSFSPSFVASDYASRELKSRGVEIFAIGYETDSTANDILTDIASEGEGHFYAGNTDEVVSAFNNIATTVNTAVAGSDAVITDGLGANFSLVGGQGQEGAVFVKNIGDISSGGVAYTFTIKINDDYLPSGIMYTNDIKTIILSYMVGSENKEVVLDNSAYINFTCEGLQHVEKNETTGKYECKDNQKTGICDGTIPENAREIEGHGTFVQNRNGTTYDPSNMSWTLNGSECGYQCNSGFVANESNVCKDDKNNNGTPDDEEYRTITYKDGANEEVFADEVHTGALDGLATPAFEGSTGRVDYVFVGWNPVLKATVDGDQEYEATWKDDKNNNGTPDDQEGKYTVTYTDGVDGEEVFTDKVFSGVLVGTETPKFGENPTRTGYVFSGWNPAVTERVTADATYAATWKDDKNNNGIDDSIELVAIRFKAGDHGKIGDGTGYTTDKNLLPGYDKFPAAPNTTADNGWVFNGWSPSYKAGDVIPLSGAELVYTAQRKQRSGGGGGSSSSSYSCKNLPLHAIENNKDKPTKDTDYTYSQNTGAVCTFQCISGYTRNADKKQCVKSGGGNGGGDEVIELGGQVSDKCSVEGSNYSEEEKAAYLYACENDITTIRDIEDARLGDFLTRAEMAKMISVFATKELGMKPNTSKDCSNFAESIASYNQEMKDFMVMSCQLEIMGIHTTNYEPIPDFMPSKRVSRAEFGTVLSRILWGNKYEGTNSNYYVNHLNALKESNIITNINPHITEYRAWVFLMLYRSVEAIKLSKDTTNETVEEQVDEELQEEGKAQTGLVTEYDSGSVVPEMATETASGTLATGTVAEVGAGSTVESKTGDTVTTTGDIAKDEAKVETESTTGSAN